MPSSTQFTELNNLGGMPVGDPDGVEGGDPIGTGKGGVGSGKGLPGTGAIPEEQFKKLGVEQPVLIHRIQPDYPKSALAAHIQGTVVLEALITLNGEVQNIRVTKSAHQILNKAAM